jgi:hypothetical protein
VNKLWWIVLAIGVIYVMRSQAAPIAASNDPATGGVRG